MNAPIRSTSALKYKPDYAAVPWGTPGMAVELYTAVRSDGSRAAWYGLRSAQGSILIGKNKAAVLKLAAGNGWVVTDVSGSK
jgi:hypothetical protein